MILDATAFKIREIALSYSLPAKMLGTLHELHSINLEKRFIFMVEVLNLDGLISIGKFHKATI